jgi:hypothetical protein
MFGQNLGSYMTPNAFKGYMSKYTFKPTKACCPQSFANMSKLHMIVGEAYATTWT